MTTANFIQTICEQYNESDLARAILESFDYFDTFEDFKNHISDVCRYGCVSGVSGYIYYSETSRFFKEHADEIRGLVITRAEEYGESCLEMVHGFESLKDYSIDEIGRAIFGAYDEDLYYIYIILSSGSLSKMFVISPPKLQRSKKKKKTRIATPKPC